MAGGRFKKEIVVDGQSYLLLIRDEGGPPEAQVSPKPLFPCFSKLPFKELALLCSALAPSHLPARRIPALPSGEKDFVQQMVGISFTMDG